MLRRGVLSLILICATLSSLAATSAAPPNLQREFVKQFQTLRVYFPDENSPFLTKNAGRYPSTLNFLFQNLLAWVPSGEGRKMSAKCDPELWGGRLQDPRIQGSVLLQGALIQKYFKDCNEEISTGRNSDAINMLKMMTMKFQPQEHPFLQQVVFSLPGNVKLKGLLGLKGDFKKRPLAVFRLGIFSNVEEFLPERPWLMMLFEQAPFNVLVLENMSGADFIADNSQFSFGGYDEGIQNILVAQILRDPNEPISRLIDSMHLFGVSLGGHGVLFASLLNDLNSPKGKPLYQSFMGICPVVNLENTMNNLTSDWPLSWGVDLWSRKRLAGLAPKLPETENHESFAFLKKVVSEIARSYRGGLSYVSSLKLPDGMMDGPKFWELNNFWPYYKNVKAPVLIFSTHSDPVVPYRLNSQTLQNKTLHVDSSNISVVDFPEGMHCTLPIPYDWKALSTLVQSYVMSHSPGFKIQERSLEMEIADSDKGLKLQYKVRRPEIKENFVRLTIDLADEKDKNREMNLNLPLSQFDFRFFNPEMSASEQWMMERWLNQNLKLKIVAKDGKSYLRATWPVAR